ncbi:NUDIX hydrolase domain-like domain-containing protein [Trypanosoma cruzi]|uniref:NUDIX hydrolase domain-like domain-containing protein n=1 Tax=Trypanosoma cruzi TaxID=5693 RepID=A0A7J6YLC1_TRYCR|nr:NUDIX hydrolase domain-like domain-containing protein [Trypanosoma cruzi]KAF8295124.1 NUDIX hydrolase domain-like domain-containing protein [Trypanosoma cruzi]
MVDDSGQFEVVFLPGEGALLSPRSVMVTVCCSHNRVEEPSVDRDAIDNTWEFLVRGSCGGQEMRKGEMYNGLKFRLYDVEQEGDKCHIKLGITDYKTNIGTTRNIGVYTELANLRNTTVENYLANALGVECFTITSDGKGVLFRRSEVVGEYPNYFCFPGGHPEPGELLNVQQLQSACNNSLNGGSLVENATKWFECVNSHVLTRLLFEAAVSEVSDELGVDPALCVNQGIIGFMKNTHSRKADACFWIELKQPASEIKACFDLRRGSDAFESVPGSMLFVDLDRIRDREDALRFVSEELEGKLAPPSLACLLWAVNRLRNRSSFGVEK